MGRRPLVGPEIHDLCWRLKARNSWSYERIAEHLLATHKIGDPIECPSKPVHPGTIMRWVRKGTKDLTKEEQYRHRVETALASAELDGMAEMLADQTAMGLVTTFDDVLKFLDMALKIRKERSATFGVYAPRQKDITLHGGVEMKGLDPQTAEMLADLERHVDDERERNGRA